MPKPLDAPRLPFALDEPDHDSPSYEPDHDPRFAARVVDAMHAHPRCDA
jgi:hypothetical protein